MKETKTDIIQDENGRVNMLASRIEALITEARSKVASFVNTAKTLTTGQQIGSSLYERLALSRNKDEIIRLTKEGQTIEKPSDIIKDPVVLEFMGLKSDANIYAQQYALYLPDKNLLQKKLREWIDERNENLL